MLQTESDGLSYSTLHNLGYLLKTTTVALPEKVKDDMLLKGFSLLCPGMTETQADLEANKTMHSHASHKTRCQVHILDVSVISVFYS